MSEETDLDPRWQKVEPGHVIPAGQPHIVRYIESDDEQVPSPDFGSGEWFVDSSWKPPLELPTEPTWGIAMRRDNARTPVLLAFGDKWRVDGETLRGDVCRWFVKSILDFVPFTPEQVARIEAQR